MVAREHLRAADNSEQAAALVAAAPAAPAAEKMDIADEEKVEIVDDDAGAVSHTFTRHDTNQRACDHLLP